MNALVRRLSSFGLALALALPSVRLAHAEPSKADISTAKENLKEGRALRAKGDLAGALPHFRAAYALVPTPITGLDFAKCLLGLGSLVEARSVLVEVVQMPVAATEIDEHKKARADADDLAAQLQKRIPSLTVRTQGLAAGVTAKVTIDGEEVPKATLGVPRLVDPGKRVVRGTALGYAEVVVEVQVEEGKSRDATLVFVPSTPGTVAPVTTPATGAAPTAAPEERSPKAQTVGEDSGTSRKTVGVVLVGAGLVIGVASGLMFASGRSTYADADGRCQQANGTQCQSQADADALSKGAHQKTLGIVGLGLGAATIATGVILVITVPAVHRSVGVGRSKFSAVAVGLSPTGIIVSGRFGGQ